MFMSPCRAEPALWLAHSKTAKVYLFGTMHILPKKADWLTGKVAAAFGSSSVLMEEADVGLSDASSLQGVMSQAIAPNFDLWSKLSPDAAAKFRAETKPCGLPDAVVAHFRPWFAAMLPTVCALMQEGGGALSVSGSSPEAALVAQAKHDGKMLDFFETAQQQIGYLASAPEDVQIKELESTIDEENDTGHVFGAMEESWLAGNVTAIAAEVAGMRAKGADFYDTIFTRRNVRFAARIAELLKGTKTVFVAIGAGHLAGPDSVQAQLGKMSIEAARE